MLSKVYFEIQADDMQRAADFYAELFGWKFHKTEGLPVEYWHINESAGGLLKRPAKSPPEQCGTNAFVCSFMTDNFDNSARKILSIGGKVAMPKFPIPGRCWQGYFLDTEGNTFGLYEPDERAGQ